MIIQDKPYWYEKRPRY